MAQLIYKILTPMSAAPFFAEGALTPSGVDAADGYVHFSTAEQLVETLDKHYAGYDDLVLLAVDAHDCGADLRWELSRNEERFPHLYAILRVDMVQAHMQLNAARDGLQTWLAELASLADTDVTIRGAG